MTALYNTWAFSQALPELFAKIIEERGKRRVSIEEKDCSRYNTVKGKSSTLHSPTLRALLWMIGLMERQESGATGFQMGDSEVNFYCLEYEKEDGRYALVYNKRNGKIKGLRRRGEAVDALPPVSEMGSSGEEYMALFIYMSIDGTDRLHNEEFASNFFNIRAHMDGLIVLTDDELLSSAFVCCDNLYRRIESGNALESGGIPLENGQMRNFELITQHLLTQGIYRPNEVDCGEFEILRVGKMVQETTLGELKGKFYRGETYPEEYERMILNLPARLFMLAGESGAEKTTDSKIIAQALGYPHFVFTCGPNTEETSMMVSILPNIDSCKQPEELWPTMEDFLMDPASAIAELSGTYPKGIGKEEAFQKVLEEIYQRGYNKAKGEKESTIIQACRMPSVIEQPGL